MFIARLEGGLGAFDKTLVQQFNVAEIFIFDFQRSFSRLMENYPSIYIKSLLGQFFDKLFLDKNRSTNSSIFYVVCKILFYNCVLNLVKLIRNILLSQHHISVIALVEFSPSLTM